MKQNVFFKRSTIAVALGVASSSVSPLSTAQSLQMEEIVVTATRRSQSTMDVPYNISAISAESLERTGVVDFSKLVQMVPGLAYIDQGPRDAGVNSTLIMRGLNADAGVGSDVISLAAPTVSTYIDETPLFVNLHLYDLARVEVLRGPQGTLYGSGSLGGTIRYIHEKPDLTEFSARIDTRLSLTEEAGDENYDLAGVINLPVTDSFAIRVAGGQLKNSGFTDANRAIVLDNGLTPTFVDPTNPFTSPLQERRIEDHDDGTLWHVRASALWQVNDRITANLAWQHQEDQYDGAQIVNTAHPDGGKFAHTNSVLEELDRTVDVVALDLDIDLGFASLASNTSYFENEHDLYSDQNGIYLNSGFWYNYLQGSGGYLYYDGFGAENVLGVYNSKLDGFAQELRLASQGDGPVDWLVGLFYLDQSLQVDQNDLNTGSWGLLGYPGSFGLGLDDTLAVLGRNDSIYRQQIDSSFKDMAIFGEVTYHFTEQFQITGGVRVFEQEFSNTNDIFLPFCSSFCANDTADPWGRTGGSDSAKFSDQIFKLNTSYDLNEDTMVYATWSEGFRRGGANGIPTTESAPGAPFAEDPLFSSYTPDQVTNWEAGIKGAAAEGRVQYSAAVFLIDWEDIQLNIASPVGAFPIVTNGNKARSQGVELEVTVSPTANLRATLGYAYADAQLTEDFDIAGLVGEDGTQLPGAPEHMLSWTGDYIRAMGAGDIVFHIDGSYMSEVTNGIQPDQSLDTDTFMLWNLNISYEQDQWRLGLFVDNLFNERYESAIRGNRYNSFENPFFDDPANTNYAGSVYEGLSYNDTRNIFASQQDSPGKQLQSAINRPRTLGLALRYAF